MRDPVGDDIGALAIIGNLRAEQAVIAGMHEGRDIGARQLRNQHKGIDLAVQHVLGGRLWIAGHQLRLLVVDAGGAQQEPCGNGIIGILDADRDALPAQGLEILKARFLRDQHMQDQLPDIGDGTEVRHGARCLERAGALQGRIRNIGGDDGGFHRAALNRLQRLDGIGSGLCQANQAFHAAGAVIVALARTGWVADGAGDLAREIVERGAGGAGTDAEIGDVLGENAVDRRTGQEIDRKREHAGGHCATQPDHPGSHARNGL